MKKRTVFILLAAVAAATIGAATVGAVVLLLRSGGGGRSGSNYLLVRLEGPIPEQPPSSDLEAFFERRPPSVRALVESMERAAMDPKIKGLLVRVSALPESGWAKAQELRDGIVGFRKSGKPAFAHLEFCGNKEFFLATACSKIYAVPSALLGVTGLSIEVTFLRQTLDKLGIEAEFEGIGKYKNAPDVYTQTGFTAPHREQTEALLDSLFDQYVQAISESRGKSPEEVRRIIDGGPYDAEGARAVGLVDELLYRDQVEEKLGGSGDQITPGRYLKVRTGFSLGRPRIAVVYAVGDIVPGGSQSGSLLGGDLAGSDSVGAALRQAREDPAVKAIVMRVDSPGGFAPAADAIWYEVDRARKTKPTVVSMGDYAASGGYFIAMGSDTIVAQPGTITGSIGVFGGKFNLKGLYQKIGLSKEIVTRGQHAAIYSEYRPWTEEERHRLRGQMAAFYRDFVSRVSKARNKSYQEIDAIAQGRVWTGVEAHRLGLVDALGGFDKAVELAKKKAGISRGQEVALMVFPERKGFFEALTENQDEGIRLSALPADLRSALRLRFLLRDGLPLARLPYHLEIR